MKVKKVVILVIYFCISIISGISQVVNKENIKGTKVSMVPPEGFTPALKFFGYENAELGSSIMVNDLSIPFADSNFTREEFEKRGMILDSKDEIVIDGRNAFLYTLKQDSYGIEFKKYLLVFGDTYHTVLLTGTFPKSSEKADSIIKVSLLTVEYNKDIIIDPLASCGFSINIENWGYKFAFVASGTFAYTLDGELPTKSEGKEVFMVGNSISNVAVGNKKEYSLKRFKMLPYASRWIIKSINEVSIDTLPGYEIVAYENVEGRDIKLIYFVMLFGKNSYYLINATAATKMEDNLTIFKEIAGTFKRK